MAPFAGATTNKAPFPYGAFEFIIPADIKNNINAAVVAEYLVPFDCNVLACQVDCKNGGAALDNFTILTKDETKQIVAASWVPVAGAGGSGAQYKALHADMSGYTIKSGDTVQLKATSTTANSLAHVCVRLYVQPVYAPVVQS